MSPRRPILLFLLIPTACMSQWLAAGVTGGVPLSPQSQESAPTRLLNGTVGPNDLIIKPWFAGGTVQFRLWRNFSAVGEFQYERIHQDFSFIDLKGGSTNVGTSAGVAANMWLFPLLLRYDIGHWKISPFVDAGATLRRLGALNGNGYELNFLTFQPQAMPFRVTPGGNPKIALTARVFGFEWLPSTWNTKSDFYTGPAGIMFPPKTRRFSPSA